MQVLSSQQAIAATSQIWASMVQIVRENRPKLGRGCVYYKDGTDTLKYLSLLELQSGGKELIGIAPELYSELLRVIGGGYDFQAEFVLLVRRRTEDGTKFIVQIQPLTDDGWKIIVPPEQLKKQELLMQKLGAMKHLEELREKRKPKQKRRK